MSKNRYGLSRYIPKNVKRKIRQNSKFGCVVPNCRNSFYTYEHIIPEWKDAKEHNPKNMCLLCPNHNPRLTGKIGQENYSKEQIAYFYSKIQNEDVVPDIINKSFFHGFESEPKIIVGKSTFYKISSIFNINGIDVFSFIENGDENPFSPNIIFNGRFNDSEGNEIFRINNNEWISHTDHWDLETTNGEIKIWDKGKELVFHGMKNPTENSIIINQLDMWFPPFHIFVKDDQLYTGRYSKNGKIWLYISIEADFSYGKCGIFLESNKLENPVCWAGVRLVGGEGVIVNKNGIHIGKKTGQFFLRKLGLQASNNLPNKVEEKPKKKVPPDAHYFVKGILKIDEVEYPLWTEREYFLNGQKLRNKPNSWGEINDKGEHLYYIDRNEDADLEKNKGFIGFYADDILKKSWSDKVFEAQVEYTDRNGEIIRHRVKRSEIENKKILSEINKKTGKYYHPHEFSGTSPWKEERQK